VELQPGFDMKRLLATTALLAVAVNAQAADLPAKAPYLKAPVAMVYDWTGFYIGVNAGVGMGRDYTRLDIPAGPSFERSYLNPQGGLGGGQIGYNWQAKGFTLFGLADQLVLGVEADVQGAGLSDNHTCLIGCTVLFNTQFSQKLDWFGTVRGRIGVANGPVLSYVTGGWAYGSVKTSLTETIAGVTGVFSSDQNRSGWTYGSGVEASLGGNWTGKIEYLYLNLGDRQDAFALNGLGHNLSTEFREHIFRAGLNYRIGGNSGYVTPPPANWAGFYLGGNIGSGYARDRTSLAVNFGPIDTERFNLSPEGIIGGIQAGYNWQAANWVFGVEADIQASSQRDKDACVAFCNLPASFAAYDAKLPWFGTARGRLGYSVGSTMFYATGGYAYGNIKTRVNSSLFGVANNVEFSDTKGGWTVGGGIEAPFILFGLLGPNWTAKSEYLYVDLGSSSSSFTVPVPGATTLTAITTTRVQEHIFRTGINYHFNKPVVAKY
jgi:outer membrane immunogenic protein